MDCRGGGLIRNLVWKSLLLPMEFVSGDRNLGECVRWRTIMSRDSLDGICKVVDDRAWLVFSPSFVLPVLLSGDAHLATITFQLRLI